MISSHDRSIVECWEVLAVSWHPKLYRWIIVIGDENVPNMLCLIIRSYIVGEVKAIDTQNYTEI